MLFSNSVDSRGSRGFFLFFLLRGRLILLLARETSYDSMADPSIQWIGKARGLVRGWH